MYEFKYFGNSDAADMLDPEMGLYFFLKIVCCSSLNRSIDRVIGSCVIKNNSTYLVGLLLASFSTKKTRKKPAKLS